MPPGTQPPLIIRYSARTCRSCSSRSAATRCPSSSSSTRVNQLRPQLDHDPGVQIPYPYGGKQRQVMVDLDPDKLYAYGISPADVSNAVNAQNLILPAGTAKIGKQEYQVRLNSSPEVARAERPADQDGQRHDDLHPRRRHVRDGFQVQTQRRARRRQAARAAVDPEERQRSTLDVVDNVKKALPVAQQSLPKGTRHHADVRSVGVRPRLG
jgi:multidrug efflux pump subunit AcrB